MLTNLQVVSPFTASTEFRCAGKPDGDYPDEFSCAAYYTCRDGDITSHDDCFPPSRLFDEEQRICVHKKDAKCTLDYSYPDTPQTLPPDLLETATGES